MKILLFGEFSGFFNCLKDGLTAIGHEVFLASNGDGRRNYPTDFNWYVDKSKYGRFSHILEIGKIFSHKELFKGFDVVLLIHPTIFSRYVPVIRPVFDYLINNNGKVFLSGAGLAPISMNYWYNTNEKYHNYVVGSLKNVPSAYNVLGNQSLINWESDLIDRINGYIPIWYEYAKPYKDRHNCLPTIRIPINISQFQYNANLVNRKIVFFAGISPRKDAKGYPFIKAAFDKMSRSFSDVAEFVTAGGLPFKEYMQLINRTNVILDDANSYSIAMNGLFSMAQGKIVMGGAEPIANKELGLEWNPVYNLCPDVEQICSCIEDVINKKDRIEEMGLNSRQFVEQYHNYIDISKQYISLFENN